MSFLDSPREIFLYLLTSDKSDEYFQEYGLTGAYPNERQVILDKLDVVHCPPSSIQAPPAYS